MNKYVGYMIIALCLFSFFMGRHSANHSKGAVLQLVPDTVVTVRIDTVIKEKIVPQKVFIKKTVKDTLFTTDTVKVEVLVPLSKYIFTDSLYKAEITGYRVSLDRMEIYSPVMEKRIPVPYKVKSNRWSLGVSAGYALTPKGFQPYFGIGIQYSLFSW